MPAREPARATNGTKDPVLTLTQRLERLDSKLEAKHAEADAQAEQAADAVSGLKACANRTRMSIQAYLEEDDGVEDQEAEASGEEVATQ